MPKLRGFYPSVARADEVDAAEDSDVWCSRMLCLEPEAITAVARIREVQAHVLEEIVKVYLSEFHALAQTDLFGVLEALVSFTTTLCRSICAPSGQ